MWNILLIWPRAQIIYLAILKLWQGQYSLAKSFWGFFILGSCVVPLILSLPFILTGTFYQPDVYRPISVIFWGYILVAAVGVWRSANRLVKTGSYPVLDKVKIFGAKLIVLVWAVKFIHYVTGLTAIDVIRFIEK